MEGSSEKKRTTAFSILRSEELMSRLVAMMLMSFSLEFGHPAGSDVESGPSQRTTNLDVL